jgi:hypothetical protein
MSRDYLKHFESNRHSLINKILAVYYFKSKTLDIMLYLQKVIVDVPKNYWLRCFDLKGSSRNRRTFKKGSNPSEEKLRGKTLKDLGKYK